MSEMGPQSSDVAWEQVLRRRRMVRSFADVPVEPGVLDGVLAAALRAPTAGNTEGWAVVALEGPGQTAPFWQATTTSGWRQQARRWPGLSRAPVIAVVLTNPERYAERYREPDKASSGLATTDSWPVPYWFVDAGHVIQSLLLAATAAHLGACFLGNFRGERELLVALGVPPGWRYVGAVLLGHPGGEDPPSRSLQRGWRCEATPLHRGRW